MSLSFFVIHFIVFWYSILVYTVGGFMLMCDGNQHNIVFILHFKRQLNIKTQ